MSPSVGHVYIMEKPRNITVQDGNEAKFTCNADNEFHNCTFKWYKDGVDIPLVPGKDSSYIIFI